MDRDKYFRSYHKFYQNLSKTVSLKNWSNYAKPGSKPAELPAKECIKTFYFYRLESKKVNIME